MYLPTHFDSETLRKQNSGLVNKHKMRPISNAVICPYFCHDGLKMLCRISFNYVRIILRISNYSKFAKLRDIHS